MANNNIRLLESVKQFVYFVLARSGQGRVIGTFQSQV